MALTRQEIQAKSDAKRGVKLCSFKFSADIVALLEQTAAQTGKSKTAVLSEALRRYHESLSK